MTTKVCGFKASFPLWDLCCTEAEHDGREHRDASGASLGLVFVFTPEQIVRDEHPQPGNLCICGHGASEHETNPAYGSECTLCTCEAFRTPALDHGDA